MRESLTYTVTLDGRTYRHRCRHAVRVVVWYRYRPAWLQAQRADAERDRLRIERSLRERLERQPGRFELHPDFLRQLARRRQDHAAWCADLLAQPRALLAGWYTTEREGERRLIELRTTRAGIQAAGLADVGGNCQTVRRVA